MKRFADLFTRLDETTKTNAKIEALAGYFGEAPPADAAWAVYLLIGRRFKRPVDTTKMRIWTCEALNMADWLFEESYAAVGDLAETIALLFPPEGAADPRPLHDWITRTLLPLADKPDEEKRQTLLNAWHLLPQGERFVFNKLLTGAWRVGVSRQLVIKALSWHSGLETSLIAQRLMGDWQPSADFFKNLLDAESTEMDQSRPYPFQLAHPLQADPQTLGDVAGWLAEWKWDGIRGQLIIRNHTVYIWSRGEDFITDRFPEIQTAAKSLPDGSVLDGEILAWNDGRAMPFTVLQKRITRKNLTSKILKEVPVVFKAFDLLESRGQDIRHLPLGDRRAALASILSDMPNDHMLINQTIQAESWAELDTMRQAARDRGTEGLMLKQKKSVYAGGRPRGPWWKWKIDPYTIDAVMLYAQPGHGRRAGLYTDYTFGVWAGDELVPLTKAYFGLTDKEFREVDRFVRSHTLERYGPVRRVAPALVMEIAFDGIQKSSRHKSGVALRFPRIHRWRHDKAPEAADHLETVWELLKDAD